MGDVPYELLRTSHPSLSQLTRENMWQYMTHVAAWLRNLEVQREDAIIEDPFSEAISQDCGDAMIRFFPAFGADPESRSYVALRTFFFDHALEHHNPHIEQVVMLGAGLDTRAFRSKNLEHCSIFELQMNHEVAEYKERILEAADAKLQAKERTIVFAQLNDPSWQTALLDAGFDRSKPVFWLMESTFHFLTPDQMVDLIAGIDAMSAPYSQLLIERVGGDMELELDEENRVALLVHNEKRYGEDGSVFRYLPWTVELLARRNQAGEYYGTLWDPKRFDRLRTPGGAWFIPLFSKPE